MEVAIIWFLSMVVMNVEIENGQERINDLTAEVFSLEVDNAELENQIELNGKWIRDVENWNEDLETQDLRQATAHSAFYARQKLDNKIIEDVIRSIEERVDQLETVAE